MKSDSFRKQALSLVLFFAAIAAVFALTRLRSDPAGKQAEFVVQQLLSCSSAVEQAVELLHKAKQVYCMGQGGSMAAASEICARFACITNKFRATADSHLQVMAASLMTEQDVVLFVSYSGATRDMMETLRTAKANGAKIILITHYEDSPGAKLADIVLLCGAQENPLDSGSIPIKVAVLYVAEVLVLRYILDDKPYSTEAQERTTEALAVKLL